MRVLLVTHFYPEHRGGIEIVAGELAERLTRRGVEIVWIASRPTAPLPCREVSRVPMLTWNIAERVLGFPYPLWSPVGLVRLCGEVRACDLVHLHDSLYLGNVIAYLCARLSGKPVVVTQHIGFVPYSRQALRLLLATANHSLGRLVLGGCSRCVFISRQVQGYFTRFVRFRRDPLFVPNGVATETFRPACPDERLRLRTRLGWPVDRPVMLFVGRFVEKKGLPILRSLAGKFPGCEWVFIGWGREDPASWGLANVRCLGSMSRAEIAPFYQAADLLVLPSVGEGFPLVVQEAMACGTPALISSDTAKAIPGIESIAFVSDIRPEQMATTLGEILDSPGELAARRDLVAKYAHREWDWEACADRYLDLFIELVGAVD